eukprot:m.164839 g.164839  ORF g.164839 m.164839 type:complete len:358 (-) comp31357_c0_seq1:462-1535(-)
MGFNYEATFTYIGICGVAPLYACATLTSRVATCLLPVQCFFTIDNLLYYSFQQFMRIYFECHAGLKLTFHGDRPRKENCIYMSNHQSNMDWFIPVLLGSDLGVAGQIRYILKDTLRLLPFFGWYFEQHGCIYISKGGGFSEQRLVQSLQWLANQKNIPYWMVIYPEGTRYDPVEDTLKQKERKNELAIASGVDVNDLSMVAFPRHRAFTTSVINLRDRCDAVYDVTVAYNIGKSRSRPECCSMETLMAGGYDEIHVHLKRHEMVELPSEAPQIETWLINSFLRKSRMLSNFYNGDEMPGDVWYNKESYAVASCAIFWNVALGLSLSTSFGRRLYVANLLVGGVGGVLVSACVLKYNR